jgi:UDPglucose 6-dehydrogenase
MLSDLDYLNTRNSEANQNHLTVHQDPYTALKDAHGIAVLTEWDEFKTYDWQHIYNNMQKPAFVFDGRNILDRKELEKIGFEVYTIGKGE